MNLQNKLLRKNLISDRSKQKLLTSDLSGRSKSEENGTKLLLSIDGKGSIFVLGLLFLVLAAFAEPGFAATRKEVRKAPQSVIRQISPRENAMIRSLLLQSRAAYNRWDTNKAKALLFQARVIDPRIPDPEWLKVPPGPKVKKQKALTREQLINNVLTEPGEANFIALENYLKAHPRDQEARKILLQTTISAGSAKTLQRILTSEAQQTPEVDLWVRFLKWFFLPLALAGLVWQTYRLWNDLRSN